MHTLVRMFVTLFRVYRKLPIRTHFHSHQAAQTPGAFAHLTDMEAILSAKIIDRGQSVQRLALLVLAFSLMLVVPAMHADTSSTDKSNGAIAWELAQSNPRELMRRASQNELANSYGHRAPLRYQLRKVTAKSDTTKEIVETQDGAVARLIAIGGHPLSAAQEQQEAERLHALDADPAIEAHRRKNELRDTARIEKFINLLPAAFLYKFMGSAETADGRMIRLSFEPNPKFSPPDFESRILTGIRGEVWIDPEELRVARVEGQTFRTVDFGWGILGSLYPGGIMRIEQSKTKDCGWQLMRLNLHLDGKELVFKSLHIALVETATDYQMSPREWKYRDAVQWLLQMPTTTAMQTRRP